ncbi:MAG: UvrD-helicase domain-containing protein [Clostridia bacterium]|nr:UvrD-helicase domain-containing protein [Clostridia bacterium]
MREVEDRVMNDTEYTPDEDQDFIIKCNDNVIVSASAGSGKTTVMIECLVNELCSPGSHADLRNVIAVTFTDEAAASMKNKLRDRIIQKINADDTSAEDKERLKEQLELVPSADISTIHSFCAQLVRRYFYYAGCDRTFDILADDTVREEYMRRAVDSLFDELYDRTEGDDNSDFKLLLKYYYGKGQKDGSLRELITTVYSNVRSVADYRTVLENMISYYTPERFEEVYKKLLNTYRADYYALAQDAKNVGEKFLAKYPATNEKEAYESLFTKIADSISKAQKCQSFDSIPADLFSPREKVVPVSSDGLAKKRFTDIRNLFKSAYPKICKDILSKDEERDKYLRAGDISRAFINILLAFDDKYSALKRDLNVLDYNDLEHKAIELLKNREVKQDIREKYKYVYVDEYQDINPVQNRIISAITGEDDKDQETAGSGVRTFYVGDSKQAIYGFRGSKSSFFTEKAADFTAKPGCSTLYMKYNHRSLKPVINSVNDIFSATMQGSLKFKEDDVEVDASVYPGKKYSEEKMEAKKEEPADNGDEPNHLHSSVEMVVFGKKPGKASTEETTLPVYSVRKNPAEHIESRQGLAVLQIVQDCLSKQRYNADKDAWVDINYEDICILSRTKKGAKPIEDLLVSYGYPVSSVEQDNICDNAYVKQMLDILTYIDNTSLDVPMVSALLSPLGNLTEDDLAEIRISTGNTGSPFSKACRRYMKTAEEAAEEGTAANELALKLNVFYDKVSVLRKHATVLTAGEIIDEIIGLQGFTEQYPADGGETMRYIRELIKQGSNLSVTAFLNLLEDSDNEISVKASAPSDSIRVMTMHGAKGLEFPIVIITDICKTYTNPITEDIVFNMKYGLAPSCYDEASKTKSYTVLRKLETALNKQEDNKNEINVFYVACTRAINNLYIMAESKPGYRHGKESKEDIPVGYLLSEARRASSYDKLINFDNFIESGKIRDLTDCLIEDLRDMVHLNTEEQKPSKSVPAAKYAYASNIPLKSSASAMVKAAEEDAEFPDESDVSKSERDDIRNQTKSDGHAAERGTAYHRFLELCDFGIKDEAGIQKELEAFVEDGSMSAEEAGYLTITHLKDMVNMDIFSCVDGAEDVRREQSFYCPIPAKEYMSGTDSEDEVIVQGAMDLLVKRGGKWQLIDYKYSDKSADEIKVYYAPQIRVYRQVLSRITGQAVDDIPAVIVNIKNHFTVRM